MKILTVGEIIFDIFDGEAEIGGAPLNLCAHCARLGAQSAIVSGIGGDELGKTALEKLADFGVNSDFVIKNEYPTGRCIVTVKDGIPEYSVQRPAAYDKIRLSEELKKKIADFGADIFAFGTLIQRDPVSAKAVEDILSSFKFSEVFCDINLRPDCYSRESCLMCLENASILKLSAEEEPLLARFGLYETAETPEEKAANICGAFGNIRLVVFTMGENGSVIYDAAVKKSYSVPCEKAKLVSTVGAGDSYSAAFLCEYTKNGDISAAGLAGARLSAFVVSRREAIPDCDC